jgi:hypothetical protein
MKIGILLETPHNEMLDLGASQCNAKGFRPPVPDLQ